MGVAQTFDCVICLPPINSLPEGIGLMLARSRSRALREALVAGFGLKLFSVFLGFFTMENCVEPVGFEPTSRYSDS